MKEAVFIEANRTGYHPDQCTNTMTVGELISYLQDFDEDVEVFISNDQGYTYGGIGDYDVKSGQYDDNTVELY